VIKEITPWLEQNGMLPDIPDSARREGPDQKVKFYTIEIFKVKGFWDIHIRGEISKKRTSADPNRSRYRLGPSKVLVEYISYVFSANEEYIVACDSDYWETEGKGIPKKEWLAKTIPISKLLSNFLFNVTRNYKDWEEKWEALAKND
jgi:hypothetical protein